MFDQVKKIDKYKLNIGTYHLGYSFDNQYNLVSGVFKGSRGTGPPQSQKKKKIYVPVQQLYYYSYS